jgi:gamma-glutamylcyclotransferase (GGCT)/AIG2-like uncharacterized protein YtfP
MRLNIFVYGTLKRGGPNHRLIQDQRFVAQVMTQPLYRLFSLESYPGLIESASEGRSIEGEVWEIDESLLPALDRLEGVGKGLYKRTSIELEPPFDTLNPEGYVYIRSIEGRKDCGASWTNL